MATSTRPSRAEFYRRIYTLPDYLREHAIALALEVYGPEPVRRQTEDGGLKRDVEQRRKLAGDPAKYFHDVFGYRLTPQQERVLELIEEHDRVLVPSGTNLGKSFLNACYAIYRFDAVAALPDEVGNQQGARILLPGPKHATILHTIYERIRAHALRAESRGYLMPGLRSERGVHWTVPGHPEWQMEAFSPPAKVGQSVTHTASGRHHVNQVAIIEEASGVSEALWAAVEGMCSSRGNKILAAFNPTEAGGVAFVRSNLSSYKTIHLSAFDHPNVRSRMIVVPGAVDFWKVDEKVRDQCKDRGAYPKTLPDEVHRDFVYAVPPDPAPAGFEEKGARKDGQLGHPDYPLRVYRPGPLFEAQVLGQWPSSGDNRLFSLAAWDEAVRRWKENGPDPEDEPPDMVGCDPARFGNNDTCAAPRWGPGAEELLRGYATAREAGEEALKKFMAAHGCRVGEIKTLSKADGPGTAEQLATLFPTSPLNVDEGGIGASVLDHLRVVMQREVLGVVFGDVPPEPTPGEPWSENLRTAMYVRAARVVLFGLADVPNDPLLREEVLAHELKHKYRTVEDTDEHGRTVKVRKPSVLLIDKEEVTKRIGRSPDRADAFVQSLLDAPPRIEAIPQTYVFPRTDGGDSMFGVR